MSEPISHSSPGEKPPRTFTCEIGHALYVNVINRCIADWFPSILESPQE